MSKLVWEAPTGYGKTYKMARKVKDKLDEFPDDTVMVLVPSHALMWTVGQELMDTYDTYDLDQHGIQFITAKEAAITVGELCSTPTVAYTHKGNTLLKASRCVVTTFSYMGRRGFSTYYYNMLKWIDNTDTLLTQSHISPSLGRPTWKNKLTVNQVFDVQSVAGGWMKRYNYVLLDYCQEEELSKNEETKLQTRA